MVKVKLSEVKTVQHAINAKTPSIGTLVREFGKIDLMAYVVLWLDDLSEAVNLKRPLTDNQKDEIALLVITEFNNITIADICLIFKNAKMGKYGSFYESLDCPKVITWFTEYLNERMSVGMNKALTEHNEHKSESRRAEPAGEYMNRLQVENAVKNEPKKK